MVGWAAGAIVSNRHRERGVLETAGKALYSPSLYIHVWNAFMHLKPRYAAITACSCLTSLRTLTPSILLVFLASAIMAYLVCSWSGGLITGSIQVKSKSNQFRVPSS